ncbi:MAG: sigma-54-dependent Fis family transcriptional regulator [Planctomycetes bacterium]|nr:sigma-54-dependent Fis family transcriptional regulator [Planctomycetota bacterium]
MSQPRILIVDDERAIREELAYALAYEGYATAEATDGEAALAELESGTFAAVLLDIKMPGIDGMEVLTRAKDRWPDLPVIMISAHGDIETAVVAVRQGALDFLPKPFDTDRVLVSIKNALTLGDLAQENRSLRRQIAATHSMIGESPAMAEVKRLIEKAAPTQAQVLITGENGTGKEVVARQLHALSKRSDKPFVAVNCAAIPSELIESELFGHEKGAFTGATSRRRGYFESANGGTLLLDEIGDMAPNAQAKLLRTLQEHKITRLGSTDSVDVDVRVLAATNQDLARLVEEKTFREDLYYRLHVIRIEVPPLRDRLEDLDALTDHFLRETCRRHGLSEIEVTAAARSALRARPWPGNVRELKHLIEAAAILAENGVIDGEDIESLSAARSGESARGGDWFAFETLESFRAATEKEFIRRKLEENNGNIKRTAERIKIQRSNLYKKLDRYGMK